MKKQLKGYKYRIYPTKEQIEYFEKAFYVSDLTWNKLLGSYEYFKKELTNIPFCTSKDVWNYLIKSEPILISYDGDNKIYTEPFFTEKVIKKDDKEKKVKIFKKDSDKELYNSLFFNNYKGVNHNFYSDFNRKIEPLNSVPSVIINHNIDKLKKAFENMYKTNASYPNFKKIDRVNQKSLSARKSFTILFPTINQKNQTFRFKNDKKFNKINLPWTATIKMNDIPIVKHRDLPNDCLIKLATVSKENNNWFVSYICEFEAEEKQININKLDVIGIDRNVKHNVVATSEESLNEEHIDLFSKDMKLVHYNNQLKRYQRKICTARTNLLIKIYGENNILNKYVTKEQETPKIKLYQQKITKLHSKIKNYRTYKNWNIANTLAKNSVNIIFEDLKIKNMTKRAKDNKKQDGSVKRKSGLNRVMNQSALYDIKLKTEIKAKEYKSFVYSVPAHNTSQRCNCCGHISKQNRLTQSKFKCVNCGHETNADLNAGKNIKDKYLKVW